MNIIKTNIEGPLIIEPKVFGDERGFFMEQYNRERYRDVGIDADFRQDNLSSSRYGVLRGLHYQNPYAQGKLVQVLTGEVYDVAVDLRQSSPTFGKWTAVTLSAENKRQFWVPPGFAHGFCVTSEHALFSYKVSQRYAPEAEKSVLWNDPGLAIPWPVDNPIISDKDQQGALLKDLDHSALFA